MVHRKRKRDPGAPLAIRTKKIKRNAPVPFTFDADPIPSAVSAEALPPEFPSFESDFDLFLQPDAFLNPLFATPEVSPLADSAPEFSLAIIPEVPPSADLAPESSLAAPEILPPTDFSRNVFFTDITWPKPSVPGESSGMFARDPPVELPLKLNPPCTDDEDDDDLASAIDQPAYSTIVDRYEFAPLPLNAKPTSNAGINSHCLTQVKLVWRGELEDLLDRTLRPPGPAMKWPRRLLQALAKLAWYGHPDEINGLLRNKVWERVRRKGGAVRLGEVWAVVEDMLKEGRQVLQPAWDDEFSLW